MLGAVIGDVSGSQYELNNCKTKDFDLFTGDCHVTDDSVLTCAVAEAIMRSNRDPVILSQVAVSKMQELGRQYLNCGFSNNTKEWILSDSPKPYGGMTNGAAMRVGPCAYAAESREEARFLAEAVTRVSHNSHEGMQAAVTITECIFLARKGACKRDIKKEVPYDLNFTIDEIRPFYTFDYTCSGSVPQAIEAFLESESFEDTIRTAVSLGGDSDTIAAIACCIAEAYYGIPEEIVGSVANYLDERLLKIILKFEERYPSRCTSGRTLYEVLKNTKEWSFL